MGDYMKSDLQSHTESYFWLSSACNGRVPSKMSVATAMGRVSKLTDKMNPNRMLAYRLRCLEMQLIIGNDSEEDDAMMQQN